MSQQLDDKFSKLSPAEQNLWRIRHTAEHILHTVMQDMYPQLKKAMGPATPEGFYFDFDLDTKISTEDFAAIEAKMQEIIDADLPMTQSFISPEEATTIFKNNPYKLEWIELIGQRGEQVSIYKMGDRDLDLCSGPHARSTGEVKAFKLLSLAGAYWHGDEKNKMLDRIYGTAFPSQKELDDYLHNLEEAKRRDHKKLGPELDLFTFSDLIGAGLPLFTPKGTLLRNLLEGYVWELRQAKGYQKVEIPHITKKDLYIKSGHWEKFADELFRINTREGHEFAMKPMNCPHHTQIFDRKPHSYREMPQRYANTTMVYRDEQTGELSGLSRVRAITQDDAHVFCRNSQMVEELNNVSDIIESFYKSVGFDLYIRLSVSDPEHPEKYLGSRDNWLLAEKKLRELAHSRGQQVIDGVGEAAFYGPKLDYMARDSLGREWQVATNQLDLNMPNRFGLYCINEQGEKEEIVMLHAAIMGSIERFLSILIEHFAGAFPTWLSPVQVKILPITDAQLDYAQSIAQSLRDANIRYELDDKGQPLGAKIRAAQAEKVPYMIVVGGQEVDSNTITVRTRAGEQLKNLVPADFIAQLTNEIASRSLSQA